MDGPWKPCSGVLAIPWVIPFLHPEPPEKCRPAEGTKQTALTRDREERLPGGWVGTAARGWPFGSHPEWGQFPAFAGTVVPPPSCLTGTTPGSSLFCPSSLTQEPWGGARFLTHGQHSGIRMLSGH